MSNLKLQLKKIDATKYGIIIGSVMALLSFIILTVIFLFSTLFGLGMGMNSEFATFGGGLVMVILAPILYFIFGFIFGFISCLILNFILKKTDGLYLEFEKRGLEISQIGKE
ncbi:MAG: hypothetical protein ACWIPI_04595 [Polaribacter sp.]